MLVLLALMFLLLVLYRSCCRGIYRVDALPRKRDVRFSCCCAEASWVVWCSAGIGGGTRRAFDDELWQL